MNSGTCDSLSNGRRYFYLLHSTFSFSLRMSPQSPSLAPAFRAAQRRVLIVSVAMMLVACGLTVWLWFDGLMLVAAVGLCSSLVGLVSLEPGCHVGYSRSTGASVGFPEAFFAAISAGLLIRLAGTVALFLWCRYHMPSSLEFSAAMVLGWYVLLTPVEIWTVASELRAELLRRPLGGSSSTPESKPELSTLGSPSDVPEVKSVPSIS